MNSHGAERFIRTPRNWGGAGVHRGLPQRLELLVELPDDLLGETRLVKVVPPSAITAHLHPIEVLKSRGSSELQRGAKLRLDAVREDVVVMGNCEIVHMAQGVEDGAADLKSEYA
jgi:hypothetical protein